MIEFITINAATIATIFFFLIFCYVLISVANPKNKKKHQDHAKIPLKDE
jgi:cbb3-type cytochrome oxidase subunit 3